MECPLCGEPMREVEPSGPTRLELGCSCDAVPAGSTSSSWACRTCGEFEINRAPA